MPSLTGNLNISGGSNSQLETTTLGVISALTIATASATNDFIQPALEAKAPKESPVFTGTVYGVTARMVTSTNGTVQSDIYELKDRKAINIPSTNGTNGPLTSNVQKDLDDLRTADTNIGRDITDLKGRKASDLTSTNGTSGPLTSNVQKDLDDLRKADTDIGGRITNLTASNIKTTDPQRSVQEFINQIGDKANITTPNINTGIYLKKRAAETQQFISADNELQILSNGIPAIKINNATAATDIMTPLTVKDTLNAEKSITVTGNAPLLQTSLTNTAVAGNSQISLQQSSQRVTGTPPTIITETVRAYSNLDNKKTICYINNKQCHNTLQSKPERSFTTLRQTTTSWSDYSYLASWTCGTRHWRLHRGEKPQIV